MKYTWEEFIKLPIQKIKDMAKKENIDLEGLGNNKIDIAKEVWYDLEGKVKKALFIESRRKNMLSDEIRKIAEWKDIDYKWISAQFGMILDSIYMKNIDKISKIQADMRDEAWKGLKKDVAEKFELSDEEANSVVEGNADHLVNDEMHFNIDTPGNMYFFGFASKHKGNKIASTKYSWYFEEDDSLWNDPPNNPEPMKPISGPSGSTMTKEQIKRDGVKFRMLDGDKNIYGYGWIVGDYSGFEPLDDYGMPSLGATDIQYFEHGRWESL